MEERRDEFAEAGARARRALVREVEADGELTDPAWRAAFTDVPRHLFVPYYYVPGTGGYERLWSGDPDPGRRERWLRGPTRTRRSPPGCGTGNCSRPPASPP